MKLWKKASGLLKDQSSLFITGFSRRSAIRNPDIEAAVIKATTHDQFSFGYDNPDRVYEWLRLSDSNIHPVVWSIAVRVEKTRSWVVGLKALMLTHGVLCTKLPGIETIGKLPFSLSNFIDGHRHSEHGKTWGINIFIRAYFDYLDQKSVLISQVFYKGPKRDDLNLMQDLVFVRKLQGLIDLLLHIKPSGETASVFLILEAMEGVVFEVFDIYSKLCRMIADALKKIGSASKEDAALILRIMQKAIHQGKEIALYFQFCKEIGVNNASNYPLLPQVPKEHVQLLETMVHGPHQRLQTEQFLHQDSAIVLRESLKGDQEHDSENTCRTIVTSNWEKLDQDLTINQVQTVSLVRESNPSLELSIHPAPKSYPRIQELPDLISF